MHMQDTMENVAVKLPNGRRVKVGVIVEHFDNACQRVVDATVNSENDKLRETAMRFLLLKNELVRGVSLWNGHLFRSDNKPEQANLLLGDLMWASGDEENRDDIMDAVERVQRFMKSLTHFVGRNIIDKRK